jgi:hypothetical protein
MSASPDHEGRHMVRPLGIHLERSEPFNSDSLRKFTFHIVRPLYKHDDERYFGVRSGVSI